MERRVREITKRALPVLVLAIAAIVTALLVVTRPAPERQEARSEGPLVEVVTVERADVPISVAGHGTMQAARQLSVSPQISGALVWVNPKLVPGGIIREGDVLFRIDPKDHRLALEQSLAQLARARSDLAMERGRHRVAEIEWEHYQDEFGEADTQAAPSLVRREPQLEAAEVGVRSSRAEVAKNRVALSRTEVTAPFDAFVDSETAEVGLLVTPQMVVAELVGVERFWVNAVIPVSELSHVSLPRKDAKGSAVTVRQEASNMLVEREGHVLRLLGRLDSESRLARVLLAVEDPLGLERGKAEEAPAFPLLLDAYVEVAIEGDVLSGVVEVPREALHQNDSVYVLDEGRLDIREVRVVRSTDSAVYVKEGLEGGERVVVSSIPQPVDGMPLRAVEPEVRLGEAR